MEYKLQLYYFLALVFSPTRPFTTTYNGTLSKTAFARSIANVTSSLSEFTRLKLKVRLTVPKNTPYTELTLVPMHFVSSKQCIKRTTLTKISTNLLIKNTFVISSTYNGADCKIQQNTLVCIATREFQYFLPLNHRFMLQLLCKDRKRNKTLDIKYSIETTLLKLKPCQVNESTGCMFYPQTNEYIAERHI